MKTHFDLCVKPFELKTDNFPFKMFIHFSNNSTSCCAISSDNGKNHALTTDKTTAGITGETCRFFFANFGKA